jgi:hypothetical protein
MNASVKTYLSTHSVFSTAEFTEMLRNSFPEIGRATVYNKLKALCDAGTITRTSKGHFCVSEPKKYHYELSKTAKEISAFISDNHPFVDFQIWELYQMNEFVNHLFAHNTIFIEVEDMLDESIFHLLFTKYPHVLLNPTIDEYYKYAGDETIVVRKLITEAPPAFGSYKQASLEKILVDLFGRGLAGNLISKSEYRAIYEDSFKKYNINLAKMYRYARRRNVERAIKDFIKNETELTPEYIND